VQHSLSTPVRAAQRLKCPKHTRDVKVHRDHQLSLIREQGNPANTDAREAKPTADTWHELAGALADVDAAVGEGHLLDRA